MSASEELENLAVKNAEDAVMLDRQGSRGMAIAKYERAVELMLKLCSIYPEASQNRIYMNRAESYRSRIQELRGQLTRVPPSEAPSKDFSFDRLVLTEKPNVSWSDIANLEDAKRAIEESLIFPVKRPDLFPTGWPRGILFYGPPGCGKTLLAAAIGKEINAVFSSVDAASLISKWLGESEKNVAQLFERARQVSGNGQPAIIFIDEIDSIVGMRVQEVGGEVRARNQLLKEMDGLLDKTKRFHVYLIGATNKPWALDNAFIRRFQKRIYVPLPAFSARFDLFRIHTGNLRLAGDVDFDWLAKTTEGYSGSDIQDICQATQIKVVREFFNFNNPNDRVAKPREITMNDFLDVVKGRRPSVPKEMLKHYEDWFRAFEAV